VPIVDAQAVSKQFLLRHNASAELKVRFLGLLHRRHRQSVEEFWALKNVSLRIERGEGVALVGRNGSGKSTFLKLIAAIHRPSAGRLLVARHARICSMIELGVGFHPELTGRENVFLNAAIHGLTAPETDALYPAIVRYSGLEHFIDVPIKNYSSGMYMRLGFAIAANMDPDILLLDEIFAVGDADFQERCVATLRGFMDRGKTIVFVSHSPDAVRTMCRRTCVLDHGELAFDGDVESGLGFYAHLLAHQSAAAVPQPVIEAHEAGEAQESSSRLEETAEPAEDWTFEFLRSEGLHQGHRVLHLGNRALGGAGGWRAFLEEHNYVWVATGAGLAELDEAVEPFDFAVAESLFSTIPFNGVARSIAAVLRTLRPSGRFYATWFENPAPASFDAIVRSNGVTTHPDSEPYHYPFGLVAAVCDALGASVERVAGATHPGGETVLVITRRT
jgi:ABC-type polysaccharide/polyol phosphate transport system ATPase subunit